MPLPFGSYIPQAGFAFTRSYVWGIQFRYSPGIVTGYTLGYYYAFDAAGPTWAFVKVDDRVREWSSNRYTLDYVITECWYEVGAMSPRYDLPFRLDYYVEPDTGRPLLVFHPFGNDDGGRYSFQFPYDPTPGYWFTPGWA